MGGSARLFGGKRAARDLVERHILELVGHAVGRAAAWTLTHGIAPGIEVQENSWQQLVQRLRPPPGTRW